MTVVRVEGGYRNVKAVYMRQTPTDWTLFDLEGRKCICAADRGRLFFWVTENDIELVQVH